MTDTANIPYAQIRAIPHDGYPHLLPAKDLLDVLDGVLEATKLTIDPEHAEPLKRWIENHASNKAMDAGGIEAPSLQDWLREADGALLDDLSKSLAKLILGVAVLRQDSRDAQYNGVEILTPTPPATLELIWNLIRDALTHPSLSIRPNRSAQGFLAVPLCSRLNERKQIEELIRLHVWLPDGQRGNPEVAIHAHQPWARSWVLGGKGVDHEYSIRKVGEGPEAEANATHTLYLLTWDKSRQYKTHQQASCAHNTNIKVHADLVRSQTHRRGDSYAVLSNVPHKSDVAPDELHATLFYFDASRGFEAEAPVLGPHTGADFEQKRDPAGHTAGELARIADTLHRYELLMEESGALAARGDWSLALRAVDAAIRVCSDRDSPFSEYAEPYLSAAEAERAKIEQRSGQSDSAQT
ncbi:hypothetical protein C8Q77DRAFT_256020 [Trametes polyzona]|nr:hypothetical protein C8Q77DRAFT_256020 [Trametes polyzona]